MLIVMRKNAPQDDIHQVVKIIEHMGFEAKPIQGKNRIAIGIVGNNQPVESSPFLSIPSVKEVIPVTRPYKLVSREFHPENTIVKVSNGVRIGEGHFTIIAGPCAVENEKQTLETARVLKKIGTHIFRGGAYKPRTSPYSFQGLGVKGLKILAKVREETGLPVVSEAIDHQVYDLVEEYCDIVQIGARNMQNFSLLKRAGKSTRPVILKRGPAATVTEWLMAAEYILNEGNPNVILCERGIRTFCDHSRNTLDLSAILFLLKETHLPVIADPSHASGLRSQVIPLSLAARVVGAHGVMVEVHPYPEKALSDGQQSLRPEDFKQLFINITNLGERYANQVISR